MSARRDSSGFDFGLPPGGNAAAAIRAAVTQQKPCDVMDLRNLTMEDALAHTGQLPRVRHCWKCDKCGGQTVERYVEFTGRNAYLRDYERLIRVCEECGAEVES